MVWIALYGITAIAVAVAAFLFAEWVREPASTDLNRPGALAVLTGLLWPLVVAGLVELGLLAVVRSRLRGHNPPVVPRPAGRSRPWLTGASR
ncbi:MAG: hypothetical protein KDB56_01825 [Mycobacterium sp.]|nr:hypothetical protein [Mycobacterium sp.]